MHSLQYTGGHQPCALGDVLCPLHSLPLFAVTCTQIESDRVFSSETYIFPYVTSKHVQTHVQTNTHTHVHVQAHAHKQTHTQSHAYTQIHTRPYMHAHTQTHTHVHPPIWLAISADMTS